MALMTACMSPRTPGAVVVEHLHDAIEVAGAGIAGHQPLDELAADERPDVLVVEDRIERQLQILRAVAVEVRVGGVGLAAPGRRQDHVVEQQLGVQVMVVGTSTIGLV